MYVEPTWIDLLIKGSLTNLIFIAFSLVLAFALSRLIEPRISKWLDLKTLGDKRLVRVGCIIVILCILVVPMALIADCAWNDLMLKPSVREDTITVASIQPRPGAVDINSNGYVIDNSNQLMFVTTDGREFANTENWLFNKFETRTIFNQMKVNGTYRIKYYGWRNGHNNEFPNIIKVEEVINENNTKTNEYNKYFGANKGNKGYNMEIYNEYGD